MANGDTPTHDKRKRIRIKNVALFSITGSSENTHWLVALIIQKSRKPGMLIFVKKWRGEDLDTSARISKDWGLVVQERQ